MTWTNIQIAPRRRLIAAALMYGLSLTVHMTSAAGEEKGSSLQATQCAAFASLPVPRMPAKPLVRTADAQGPTRRSCRAGCEQALPS